MPERSFGRTIRFRRTKLGLSQSKLGDLVGRSPSTIRSWERDDSTPNDPEVLLALAAVLGVEQRTLFEKAGVERPEMETSPTVEQELATLRPSGEEAAESQELEISFTYEELADLAEEAEEASDDESALPARAPRIELVADSTSDDEEDLPAVPAVASVEPASPGYTDPRPAFVVTRVDQVYAEPSYMEDPTHRQLYRVRHVGTAVGIVLMLLLLMYAAGKGLEAFSAWWDSFFGQLRL